MSFEYHNEQLCWAYKQQFTPIQSLLQTKNEPFYVYDLPDILQRVQFWQAHLPATANIHYALKANANFEILQALARVGVGADVVSGGELLAAETAGISAERTVFSGVGKSRAELEQAIGKHIMQIHVESLPELKRLKQMAARMRQSVSFALRLNPDVDANTHPYIKTGFRENKFGLEEKQIFEAIELVQGDPWLRWTGLAMHIGSQIQDLSCFRSALKKVNQCWRELKARGVELRNLDVGGGLGINYHESGGDDLLMKDYLHLVTACAQDLGAELQLEPGRILVARSGVLLAQVEYVKATPHKNFLILNAGMNCLMRPALYQAHHRIVPVLRHRERKTCVYDVVGPICESADVLGHGRELPELNEGEWVAILDVGAYGRSMANEYNLRTLPEEVILR